MAGLRLTLAANNAAYEVTATFGGNLWTRHTVYRTFIGWAVANKKIKPDERLDQVGGSLINEYLAYRYSLNLSQGTHSTTRKALIEFLQHYGRPSDLLEIPKGRPTNPTGKS